MTQQAQGFPIKWYRQLGLFDPTLFQPKVVVIGAGGIGSNLVRQLTMLGVHDITVWDMDRVERHNLSTTPYRDDQLGRYKVTALKDLLTPHGMTIRAVRAQYTGQSLGHPDIVMSAVDSLSVRKTIFTAARAQGVPFLIDGRLGGQSLRVYSVRLANVQERKDYLATLAVRAADLPCMAQQIVDVGWATTSLMVRALRMWVVNGQYHFEVGCEQETLSMWKSPVSYRKKPKRPPQPAVTVIKGGRVD